ncbi:hypothetical protein ACQ856_03525 [Mycolicibacterium psychrotolerans]|uniref:hypothetical protein n=1 Tax=Mycolicibacterium psychrotolerans TaxID=216929 RepID=UPI003D67CE08
MTDIDDDEAQLHDLDFYQRLNQINSQVGRPAVMPEHRATIDAYTDAIDDDYRHLLTHDRDPVAQRIASHMVKARLTANVEHRSVFDRWCPSHDESRPETMATLYALVYSNIAYVIPLESAEQISEVAEHLLLRKQCEARVTRRCRWRPTEVLAVKRGQYVCVFGICTGCKHHIESGLGFNEDYIGPSHDWVDDRKGAPIVREWTPWSDSDDPHDTDDIPDYPPS